MFPQPFEFVSGRSPRALLWFGDQAQLATGAPCLLHDLRNDGKFIHALCGSQNHADPDQIVEHGRRAGAFRSAELDMPNEVGTRESQRLNLAYLMPLQKLEVSLLATLPA